MSKLDKNVTFIWKRVRGILLFLTPALMKMFSYIMLAKHKLTILLRVVKL